MIKGDVGLLVWTGAFFAGTFVALQVAMWRSHRVIIGGTRRFARVVFTTAVTFTSAVALCLLVVNVKVPSLAGAPFVFLYTLTIVTPLFMPALLMIEGILMAEYAFTRRIERGAWFWHLGALLVCAAWASLLVFTSGQGQK